MATQISEQYDDNLPSGRPGDTEDTFIPYDDDQKMIRIKLRAQFSNKTDPKIVTDLIQQMDELNDSQLNQYQNKIIAYFKENEIDYDMLQNMEREDFVNKISVYCNEIKIKPTLAKLFNAMTKNSVNNNNQYLKSMELMKIHDIKSNDILDFLDEIEENEKKQEEKRAEFMNGNNDEIDIGEDLRVWIQSTWNVGSFCDVYSDSDGRWYKGRVVRIFTDKDVKWLEIQYTINDTTRSKEVRRDDIHSVRPLSKAITIYKYVHNVIRHVN